MFILLLTGVVAEVIFREAYPWYFILPIGIGILTRNKIIYKLITAISLAALLRYLPYLYFGGYNKDILFIENLLFLIPLLITSALLLKQEKLFKY